MQMAPEIFLGRFAWHSIFCCAEIPRSLRQGASTLIFINVVRTSKRKVIMIRFGSAAPPDMRKMQKDDIYLSRLKLHVVISKAYLKDYPLGKYRKEVVVKNARLMMNELVDGRGLIDLRADSESGEEMNFEQIFHQRVRLLAVMSEAFAEGHPMGRFRKKALDDNIDKICEAITFQIWIGEMDFLKVA